MYFNTTPLLLSHHAHSLLLVIVISRWHSPCMLHRCCGDSGGHPGSCHPCPRCPCHLILIVMSAQGVVMVGSPPPSCPSLCPSPLLSSPLVNLIVNVSMQAGWWWWWGCCHRRGPPRPHCPLRPPCHRHCVAMALVMGVTSSLSLSC